MLTLRLCPDSAFQCRLPSTQRWSEIIALADTFLKHEQRLPLEQQTPFTVELAQLMQQASIHTTQRTEADTQRRIASGAIKRLEAELMKLVRQSWRTVDATLMDTPEMAAKWGFKVKSSTGRIQMPRGRTKQLALINVYIAQEESRAGEERFTVPDLAEVTQVRDELEAQLAMREAEKMKRETSVAALEALAPRVLNVLYAALVYVWARQFNYSLNPDLEKWGFDVVERRNGKSHLQE